MLKARTRRAFNKHEVQIQFLAGHDLNFYNTHSVGAICVTSKGTTAHYGTGTGIGVNACPYRCRAVCEARRCMEPCSNDCWHPFLPIWSLDWLALSVPPA